MTHDRPSNTGTPRQALYTPKPISGDPSTKKAGRKWPAHKDLANSGGVRYLRDPDSALAIGSSALASEEFHYFPPGDNSRHAAEDDVGEERHLYIIWWH